MTANTIQRAVAEVIAEEVDHYLGLAKPGAKFRRCFGCGEPFKLTHGNRYYCEARCSRRAHYIPFRIRRAAKRAARRAA